MGWIEDSVEEFKKLPPAGKLAVGGAAVGVVILAIAQARSSASSGATSSPTASTSTTPTSTPGTPDWSTWFSNGLTPPPSNSLSFGDLGGTNPGTPTIPQITWGNTGGSVSVPTHVAGPVKHKRVPTLGHHVTEKSAPTPHLGHHVTEKSAPTPHLGHHVTEKSAPAPHLGHHVTEKSAPAPAHPSTAYNSAQQTRLAGALASR